MSEGKRIIEEKAKEKYKILFVDDEKAMLHSIKRGLHGKGFHTLYTDSANKALMILGKDSDIGVVVSDLKMPEMNGIEFLKIVNERHPDITKIVLTGNQQIPNILATINESKIFKYLVKPWKLHEEFIPTLTEALYMFYMNVKRGELIEQEFKPKEESGFNLKEEELAYFENVLEVLKQAENDMNLIHKISEKLPFFDKSNLEKLSLDIYSRSGNVYSSLVSITNVIENVIKSSKNIDDL